MLYSSDFSQSDEYLSFRSSVPLKVIVVDSYPSEGWKIYDVGPKSVKTPLICLPPISGTADVFFRQLMALSAKGYRVISAEHPPYWNVEDWCEGFRKLMDSLGLVKAHIFGASLGGFLAQKYAERTFQCQRVASLVLCNTYVDTSGVRIKDVGNLYRTCPAIFLKRMILGSLPSQLVDKEISDSIDFMVEKVECLNRKDLSSRLSLIQTAEPVNASRLKGLPVTMTDVFDEFSLSSSDRDLIYKFYPEAKLAHLKTGGNFPYLSRSDEINLHLQIHLRPFLDSPLSARE